MNSRLRTMTRSAVLGVGVALAMQLVACRSAEHREGWLIIEGDDGCIVQAIGLEDALGQAMKHMQAALDRGDKAAAADWKKIIEQIIKKKAEQTQLDQVLVEAKATGSLTESVDDKGGAVYTWIPNEAGAGTAGS